MRFALICLVLAGFALVLPGSQKHQDAAADEEEKPRFKRSQIDEILKADRKKSIEDAGKLQQLAEELKIELEKADSHVLSVSALKKAEEIEKIAKRIRGRMRRF
ncbi:MAG: hypothetical protein IT168_25690 [Bryobacterales bacterium]|nr:hypothetical protein [Bryobacterales bacterium]